MNEQASPSLGSKTDLWSTDWTNTDGRKQGQIYEGPHGLWAAINNMRGLPADVRSATITGPKRVVVYDRAAGIDTAPVCTRCGHLCVDPSEHMPTDERTTS